MTQPIIECVPNFSVGPNPVVLGAITQAITSVEDVKLLNVDSGEATNRTVVTFAGPPDAVCEAAFRAVRTAGELIDMRHHKGAHPRMGATDVLPLVPISGITLEETADLALRLGRRIADELDIPVYAYEASALRPERKNLAVCRQGEYEGLEKRFANPDLRPDFGPAEFTEHVARRGATAVGARDFLIAVNFNLNTTSTRRANAIAFDVREKGRPKREGGSLTGKICRDAEGNPIMEPGTLQGTKAIGWFIDDYDIAQVSMNINDLKKTPLHIAFEEVCQKAAARGIRVTGTEIVGLVPRQVMLDAGYYFLHKQQRSLGIPEREVIRIAARSMGLSELAPWSPDERIIEYVLAGNPDGKKLIDMSLLAFAEETASESPAPGGGSVSAYMGALGVALGTMVANLSAHKKGWDEKWSYYSEYAMKGQTILHDLLRLVDEDTMAFDKVMACFKMPKGTEEEKKKQADALEKANLYACDVPLRTMKAVARAIPLLQAMKEKGNPNSASDVQVGLLALQAAAEGAYENVAINAAGVRHREKAETLLHEANRLRSEISDKITRINNN